jgi:sulfoxide reductase heme-binding subunit YedZ
MEAGMSGMVTGWRLVALLGLMLTAMVVALAIAAPTDVDAARLVIRWTARTSLVLFLLAFVASALVRLAPGAGSQALTGRRRALGLGFAISHGWHLAGILALAYLDPVLFDQLTNPVTIGSGVIAYLFIVAMAATSSDRAVRRLGAANWRRLHVTGSWYLFLSFLVAFGKRAVVNTDYGPAMILLALALALKAAAAYKARTRGRCAVTD